MITVKYKNEVTGQEVNFTIHESGEDQADVQIQFKPVLSQETPDPYGILSKLLSFFNPNKKE